MPKITKIAPQKRSKRYNIFLSGRFFIGLSEEAILRLNLKEGQEINGTRLKNIEKEEEGIKVYQAASRLLSYRPRSEREIFDRLVKKFKEQIVKKTIARLKKESLLDDEQFTKAWITTRDRLNPRGKRLLALELSQKGVSQDLIRKILEKEYNKDRELVLAKKIVEKKLRIYKKLPKEKVRQKISQLLLRRGFDWETIKNVLDKVCAS